MWDSPKCAIFLYEIKRQLGPIDYQFEFAGVQVDQSPRFDEDSFDVGFEEPSGVVNLDHLAKKCKNSKPLKELLTKFYRRR